MSAISHLARVEFGAGPAARLPEYLRELGRAQPTIAMVQGVIAAGFVGRRTSGLADGAVYARRGLRGAVTSMQIHHAAIKAPTRSRAR
jgi:hypothetical protein